MTKKTIWHIRRTAGTERRIRKEYALAEIGTETGWVGG